MHLSLSRTHVKYFYFDFVYKKETEKAKLNLDNSIHTVLTQL